jgi:small subunit ribosomal protein S18
LTNVEPIEPHLQWQPLLQQTIETTKTTDSRGLDMTYFRRRVSPIKPGEPIDYKDVDLLRKFVTERGKILPRRITGLTAKQQRDLTQAIKRARIMALLPFINREG